MMLRERQLRPGEPVRVVCTNGGADLCIVSVFDVPEYANSWVATYTSQEAALCDLERRGLLTVELATCLRQTGTTGEGDAIKVTTNLWTKAAVSGYTYLPAAGRQLLQ